MSRFNDMNHGLETLRTAPSDAAHSAILKGLTPDQAKAATLPGAVLVLAGAGTGKTRTL